MASSNYQYDHEWKKNLPIGFHFVPTDEELNMYLKLKSCNGKIPPGIFNDLDIYQYEPQELSGFAEKHWGGRMYFFTPSRKKYGTGTRLGRSIHSGKGVWKASQARKGLSKNDNFDKQKKDETGDVLIGTKTPLVYHQLSPSSKKTSWLMLEYRFPNKLHPQPLSNETKDEFELTLCVIYYHGTKKNDDDQISMLKECNDPIPLQSPINQNFDHSPYTSHQEINPYSYPNFVSSSAPVQQYQPLTDRITTSSGKEWPVEHSSSQNYTDIATTSTMQPSFPQLPQSYIDVPTTSTMQPSFPQLPQNYTDVSSTSTMKLSFPQLPYGVVENLDNFSSIISQNYDFHGFDPCQYLDLDNFHYMEDEEIGHIPNNNVDFIDQNKLETCVAPVSQAADQRPSSGSQDHDHQQLKMKKIRI